VVGEVGATLATHGGSLAADPVAGLQIAWDTLGRFVTATTPPEGATPAAGAVALTGELAGARTMLLYGSVGVVGPAMIAIGVLTAAGPLFIALAILSETAGLFIGWLARWSPAACWPCLPG
jgi:type IV secretion system protein VirB6